MRSVLDEVEAALDGVLALDAAGLSSGELSAAVTACQRVAAKAAALTARVVGTFDAERVWAGDGALSPQAWLRCGTRIAGPAAGRQVRHARALRTLPATFAALAQGAITSDHVARIVAADNPRTRAALRDHEDEIVGWASTLQFRPFCQRLGAWLLEHDPDGAEPAAANNHLNLSKTFDGTWRLDGWLDPLTGTVVDTELRRLEQQLFDIDWQAACAQYDTAHPTADQLPRTPAQRRADALAEMARRSAGADTTTGARISATVLLGADSLARTCELLDGTPLHPADVARWLPTSVVQRILYDGDNRPIAASTQRSFRGLLRKAVQIAYRHCGHQYCDQPAQWCDIDHVQPVHRGGTTTFALGRPGCRRHNQRRTYQAEPPPWDRWQPHPADRPPPPAA